MAHHVPGSGGGTQSTVPVISAVAAPSRRGTCQSDTRWVRVGSARTAGGGLPCHSARWSCQRATGRSDVRCHCGGASSSAAGSVAVPRLSTYSDGARVFCQTPSGRICSIGSRW